MNIEQLRYLDKKDREYAVFKSIFKLDSTEERECLSDEILNNLFNLDLVLIVLLANATKEDALYAAKIRSDNPEILYYYTNILDSMKKLALELNLANSLELSNMFMYLLRNGFLSKTRKNIYRIDGLKSITGLQFADIMDGRSVCRNHADMLNDFLCKSGFVSSKMTNTCCNENSIGIIWNRLKKENIYLNKKIIYLIEAIIQRKIGNHLFNLIEEHDGLYIFDSTRGEVLDIKNTFCATSVDGGHIYSLKPYFSYRYCTYDDSIKLLDRLHKEKEFISPYNACKVSSTAYIIDRRLSNNIPLLNDFYDEIENDIVSISKATDKIKFRQKIR